MIQKLKKKIGIEIKIQALAELENFSRTSLLIELLEKL